MAAPTSPPNSGQPPPADVSWNWTFIVALVLIAIAAPFFIIPQFLEASVRSKESRARSDMHSLATAIEAYYQDENTYPPWTDNPMLAATGHPRDAIDLHIAPTFRVKQNLEDNLMTLTTPISYITSLFVEPFRVGRGTPYRYYAVMGDSTLPQASVETRKLWIVWSTGRDTTFDITLPLLRRLAGSDPHRLTPQELAPYTYDPTNGVESGGDVWRLSTDAPWPRYTLPAEPLTSATLSTTSATTTTTAPLPKADEPSTPAMSGE